LLKKRAAAIKKAGVGELPRVIREWTLYYESEAIKFFKKEAEALRAYQSAGKRVNNE